MGKLKTLIVDEMGLRRTVLASAGLALAGGLVKCLVTLPGLEESIDADLRYWLSIPAQFLVGLQPTSLKMLCIEELGVQCLSFACFGGVDKLCLTAAQQAGDPFAAEVQPPACGCMWRATVHGQLRAARRRRSGVTGCGAPACWC